MFGFFKRKPAPVPTHPAFLITEGVSSNFHYHIAKFGHSTRSLCGAQTFHTSIPLNAWGVKDHLPSHWCKICEELVEEV